MNVANDIASVVTQRTIAVGILFSLLLAFGTPVAWAQSELRSKFEDEFYRVEKMVRHSKFVRTGKRLSKTYGFSSLFPSDSFGEGWVEISKVVSEQRQYKKSGSETKIDGNKYFYYEAILNSETDLENCFCALTFAADGGRSIFVSDIGKLLGGKERKIKLEILSKVTKMGRLHIFSNGAEIRSSEIPESYELLKDEYALLEQAEGILATKLWAEEQVQYYELSPSGRYIATVRDEGGTNRISIVDTKVGLETINTVEVGDHDDWAGSLNWMGEDEFIFVSDNVLMRIRTDNEDIEILGNDIERVISKVFGEPRKLLIKTKSNRVYFKFDLDTMTKELVGKAGSENWRRFDSISRLRLKKETKEGSVDYYYRNDGKSPWKPLDETVTQKGLRFNYTASSSLDQRILVEGFGRNDNELFVYYSDDGNTYKLAVYSLSEGRITKVLMGSNVYDMGGFDILRNPRVLRRKSTREVIGVKYSTSKPKVIWFDPDFKFVQSVVDEHFPDGVNQLINWTDDATTVIFENVSDRHPGKYYLFKPIEGRVVLLHNSYPYITDDKLGHMEPITYAARDGYKIRGYLTKPPGHKEGSQLPLVVMPHGEPWVRDYWEYKASVQFFATRGYAVLQPNYRGSGGFGLKHVKEGVENLDTVVVDDVVDGARHFVEQGIVDPNNVFIVGEGFGGYLTYMGMIKYPETFKAGVAIGAVSHFGERISDDIYSMTGFNLKRWKEGIGNFGDREFVKRISPYYHVDKIKGQIRIFHNELDLFVSDEQTRLMDEALSKTEVNYKVTYFPFDRRLWESVDTMTTRLKEISMRCYSEAEVLFRSNQTASDLVDPLN